MKDGHVKLDIQLEHQIQSYELYARPKLDMLRILIQTNKKNSVQKMIDRYVAHTSCILESCCHIINHTEQANTQNMINHY